MWLLSTDRAELHYFSSPEAIDEYAALSHTWNNKPEHGSPEQSFQDVQKIQERCIQDGTNPRDLVSEKIRRCCELAEKHGYKWVWIDTCCIDKTSSAELSEVINSMYRYYALAAICYGYLRDVDTVFFSHEDLKKQCDLPQPFSDPSYRQLWSSIWFQRGWTLQELIAPRFFVFVSRTWEVIGTKADLAEFLETKFRIPAAVHRLHASPSEFSIAQRMSWFGLRQTTRPEDEAYCLLGLFEINMPPLYGEGRNAFRRLQEEIMKQTADTTLFAWRGVLTDSPVECLFAASPADFTVIRREDEIVYTPPRRTQVPADTTGNNPALGVRADMNEMTFAVTPGTGVRANIPIFTWRGGLFGDLYWSSGDGRPVFLHLEPDPESEVSSSPRPSYRVGKPRLTGSEAYDDACLPDGPPSWQEVLIRHRLPLHRAPGQLPASATFRFTPAIPMQLTFDAPVRFPEARIWQFLIQSESDRFEIRGAGLESPWTADSTEPVAYVFVGLQYTIIKIGQCLQDRPPGEQRRPKAIWVTLSVGYVGDNAIEVEAEISKVSADTLHGCSRDHVLQWPDLRKRFTIPFKKEVTLSFTPCPLNPERTLVLEASCRLFPLPDCRHPSSKEPCE